MPIDHHIHVNLTVVKEFTSHFDHQTVFTIQQLSNQVTSTTTTLLLHVLLLLLLLNFTTNKDSLPPGESCKFFY